MNQSILKKIIKIKLERIDQMIAMFPKELKNSTLSLRNNLINAIYESAKEYIEEHPVEKKEKNLKSIEIE